MASIRAIFLPTRQKKCIHSQSFASDYTFTRAVEYTYVRARH